MGHAADTIGSPGGVCRGYVFCAYPQEQHGPRVMKLRFDFIFWLIVFTMLSICNWAIAHAQTTQNGFFLVCNGTKSYWQEPNGGAIHWTQNDTFDCCTPMKAELAAETATPPLAY